MAKRPRGAPKDDDAMRIGILSTRYIMGQITIEDLEKMGRDQAKPEKAAAAKKVLERLI